MREMHSSSAYLPVGTRRSSTASATQRAVIISAILLAHAGVIALVMGDEIMVRRVKAEPPAVVIELFPNEMKVEPASSSAQEGTRVDFVMPQLSKAALPVEEIEAPRIDESVRLDVTSYSERAGLEPGTVAAVLLLLEIGADGSVVSAQIVRGINGDAANAAAIEYARATHWIPGRVDGEPRAMQASLTVILGEGGRTDQPSALPTG